MKVFYVCSWGGCGSKLLCRYLNNFGKAIHIHDPDPPDNLEYIGFKNNNWGWCPYDLPEYEDKHKNIMETTNTKQHTIHKNNSIGAASPKQK